MFLFVLSLYGLEIPGHLFPKNHYHVTYSKCKKVSPYPFHPYSLPLVRIHKLAGVRLHCSSLSDTDTGESRQSKNTLRSYLSVTMIADGWAHAVIRVTMKRNIRNGMSVLQVRSHFPETA